MPRINGSESNAQLLGKNYVRVGQEIAYEDSPDERHETIALDYFPDVEMTPDMKPIVNDKVYFEMDGGKLVVAGWIEGSVEVNGTEAEVRAETTEILKKTYGTERIG